MSDFEDAGYTPSPTRRVVVFFLDGAMRIVNRLAHPWMPGFQGAQVTDLEVPLRDLPPAFDNYRLVQFSDLHLGSSFKAQHLHEVVDQVNALQPDTIAITGDFVSRHPDHYAPLLVEALSRLQARDLKLAVLGNHDHYTDTSPIRWALKQSGILELRNRSVTLQRGADVLHLAGVDDQLEGMDRLDRVLEQLPPDGPAVLLAHEPDFAQISQPTGRFGLQISGHTHGGQIHLPPFSRLMLPPYGRKFPPGWQQLDGMVLYTNRGLGTSWLNLRYRCPPEITLYRLRS